MTKVVYAENKISALSKRVIARINGIKRRRCLPFPNARPPFKMLAPREEEEEEDGDAAAAADSPPPPPAAACLRHKARKTPPYH